MSDSFAAQEGKRKLTAMRPMVLLLIIASLASSSFSQSPKQQGTDKPDGKTQIEKPASERSVPAISNTPPTQFYTFNNQKAEENDAAKKISDYLLAIFTLALVVVSFMQWRVLRKHEEWMQKHDANLEKLAQSAVDNAKATADGAKAASTAIRLTHRPKLIIRNIVIHGLAKLNRQSPMNDQSPVLSGYYAIANIGGLPATIQRRKEGTWCNKVGLPMERPDKGNPGTPSNDVLAPGESKEFTFDDMILSTDDAVDLILQDTIAYFLVQVEYTDEAGVSRQTSACRKFFSDTKRFGRLEDPDYEYAD